MQDNDLDLISAGVAFYALLSVFPAVAAVISIFGLVADPHVVEDQLVMWRDVIPPQAYTLFDAQIRTLLAAGRGTLGWTTGLSILIALWSARAGVGALIRGINAIFGAPTRGGVWHLAATLLMTFSLIGMALTALLLVVVAPAIIALLPPELSPGWVGEAVRWFAALGLLVMGLGILYRYAPNHGDRIGLFSTGQMFTLVTWFAASVAFSAYLTNFGRYNEIYGSLGAVVALLMWFYISAYLVLLGAAINVVLTKTRTD